MLQIDLCFPPSPCQTSTANISVFHIIWERLTRKISKEFDYKITIETLNLTSISSFFKYKKQQKYLMV